MASKFICPCGTSVDCRVRWRCRLKAGKEQGWFAGIAFKGAFLGSVFLLAHEWTQVFYVHDVAGIAPDALAALEGRDGMGVSDIGTLISLFFFTFGWLAFAAAMLRSGGFNKFGPILIIVGFFAMPMLSAALPQMWGLIVGNAILSAGWLSVGRDLFRFSEENAA